MSPLHVRLSASSGSLKSSTAHGLWKGFVAGLALLCLGVGAGIGAQEKGEAKEGLEKVEADCRA